MISKLPSRITFANAISLIALFVALGGTSYAAVTLSKNSVGAKQIKPNAVRASDVKNGTLTPADFRSGAFPSDQAQGATGPAGPQGPQGEKGEKGDTGEQGPAGGVGVVTVQRTDVALADNSTQAVEASCLPGQTAVSGGSSVDQTGSDDIKLLVSRPGNGGFIPADGQGFSDWRAVYRNPAGGTGAAEIRVFVVCAETPL